MWLANPQPGGSSHNLGAQLAQSASYSSKNDYGMAAAPAYRSNTK
jgi:hypothetical protein